MPYSTNERTESDKGLDRAKQGTETGLNEGVNSVDRLGRNTNKLVNKANKARDFLKNRKNFANKGAKTGADATNTAADTGNTTGTGATATGTGGAATTGVGATTGSATTGSVTTGSATATGGAGATTTGTASTTSGAAATGTATASATAGTGATVGGISSTGYGALILAIIAIVIILIIVLACIFCILYAQITAALLGMESESENNSEITARAEEIMENFWAYTTLSPGKDRSKDAEKLVEIQNNGYTTALCAVYEELVYNGYYGNSKLNGEDDNTYDKIFSTPNESMFNERFAVYYLDRKKNKNSSYVTDFLYNRKKSFYNFDGKYTNDNYVNTAAHYYYSDNIMSMCINAFVDPDTGEIYKDIDTFKSEYQNHLKNNNKTIPKDKDELSEGCRKYVFSKVLKNIEGKKGLANTCVVYQSRDEQGKDSYLYFYDHIKYTQKMDTNYKIPKSVKETIYSYEVTFRTLSSSSATSICNLALEQDGNDGYKYWNNTKAWTGGEGAAWCSIFCAWLMEQQGINVNDVGWSARCSVWVGNAKSKGIFRSADTYKPKAGDFIFFDWDKGDSFVAEHVGIVVSTDNGKIMTIEGNSTGGRVRHNDKTHDTGVIGYIEMTYSENNIIGSGIEQPLLNSVVIDSKYKGYKLSLTSSQRRRIECLVTNENKANGYIGCCLIAQCIKDAIRYEKKNADNIKAEMGYSAADTGKPCENAKKAVKYVFDDGGYAVKHKLLYMYNPNLCTSTWHESQVFVVEHGSGINRVRYFDNYKKIN